MVLSCGHLAGFTDALVIMSLLENEKQSFSRRAFLKSMGLAPLLLRPAPFYGASFLFRSPHSLSNQSSFAFTDVRLTPHYPAKSPLADILRLVTPGSDEYITEKYAFEIELLLGQWAQTLRKSARDLSMLAKLLAPSIEASSLIPIKESSLRSGYGIDIVRRQFDAAVAPGRERFLQEIHAWLGQISRVETAEFEMYGIEVITSAPLTVRLRIRYDIVASRNDERREERVGSWRTEW